MSACDSVQIRKKKANHDPRIPYQCAPRRAGPGTRASPVSRTRRCPTRGRSPASRRCSLRTGALRWKPSCRSRQNTDETWSSCDEPTADSQSELVTVTSEIGFRPERDRSSMPQRPVKRGEWMRSRSHEANSCSTS